MTYQDIVKLQEAIQALVQERNTIETTIKEKTSCLTSVTVQQFEAEVASLNDEITKLTEATDLLAKQLPLKELTTPIRPKVPIVIDEVLGESSEDDELAPVQTDDQSTPSMVSEGLTAPSDELVKDWATQLAQYLRGQLSSEGARWLDFLIKKAIAQLSKTFGGYLTDVLEKEFTSYIKRKREGIAENITAYYLDKVQKDDVLMVFAESFITSYFNSNDIGGLSFDDLLNGEWSNIMEHKDFQVFKNELEHQLLRGIIRIGRRKVKNSIIPILDSYLGPYAIWKGILYDTGSRRLNIGPFWGFLNIGLRFQASLKASLTAERKNLSILATGTLSGNLQVGVGLAIGMKIPYWGDATLSGGLKGGPFLNAKAGLVIGVEKGVLQAGMQPVTLNIDMKAFIYIDTPLPEDFLTPIGRYMKYVVVEKQTLSYEIGSVNILTAKTPAYLFTFDLNSGKYSLLSAKGNYVFKVNPTITNTVNEIKKTVARVMEDAKETIASYTEVDLNPFDSEGWIGSHFT